MLKQPYILVTLLLYVITCDQSSNNHAHPLSMSSLQFDNQTGKGLTEQQLKFFIEFANYATEVYGDNVQKCTRYIKSRMDALFGIPNYNFLVFIQTAPTQGSSYVWVNHDGVSGGLAGINHYYPQWSYFFSRNYGTNQLQTYVYIWPGQRGKGITQRLESIMRDLIDQTPQDLQCLCPRASMESISRGLSKQIYGGWSIICAAEPVTYGLTLNYQDLWISTKEKGCYYTVFNN